MLAIIVNPKERRPMDGSSWSTLSKYFREVTAVGMSVTISEKYIATKLILKLGGEISIFGAKIIQ